MSREMYRLYEEWFPPVKKKDTSRQYREIFNTLNPGFPDFCQVHLYSMDLKPTRKRKSTVFVFSSDLIPVYNGTLLIGEQKFCDLKELCRSGIIPKIHHAFYQGLNPNDVDLDLNEVDEFLLKNYYDKKLE
jgi:hypothetical protein